MEANIVVSGVPRYKNAIENERRVNAAIAVFQQRYPGAIIEMPRIEPLGKSSQTITFAVTAHDFKTSQEMHAFFEKQLVEIGFNPTDNPEDTEAAVEDLINIVSDSNSNVTYVKDSSRIGKEQTITGNKDSLNIDNYYKLVEELGKGIDLAKDIAENKIKMPTDAQFLAMAGNDNYLINFMRYFQEGFPNDLEKNLLFKLRGAPDFFKENIAHFIRRQAVYDNGKLERSSFPYWTIGFGLLLLIFIIYSIFSGKDFGWFTWVFMSVVSILCLITGISGLYGHSRKRRFQEELPYFADALSKSNTNNPPEGIKPSALHVPQETNSKGIYLESQEEWKKYLNSLSANGTEPHISWLFDEEWVALLALKELSCIESDGTKLISTKELTFGVFQITDAKEPYTWSAFLAGKNLNWKLFFEAQASFKQQGGQMHSEEKPTSTTPLPPDVMKEQAEDLIAECLKCKFKTLDLGKCGLKDLRTIPSLFGCTHLETLILGTDWSEFENGYFVGKQTANYGKINEIKTLSPSFSKLINLKKFVCTLDPYSKLRIGDIAVLGEMPLLESLHLNHYQIPDYGFFSKLVNLRELSIHHCKELKFDGLSNLKKLEHLSLSYNNIDNINFLSDLTELQSLFLGNNQIVDCNTLSKLTHLKHLFLNGNKISDIKFLSNLKQLEDLLLNDNEIIDASPISHLSNLQELYLSNNQISKIDFLVDLPNLKELHFTSNYISDIKVFQNLKQLEKLSIDKNPFLETYNIELKRHENHLPVVQDLLNPPKRKESVKITPCDFCDQIVDKDETKVGLISGAQFLVQFEKKIGRTHHRAASKFDPKNNTPLYFACPICVQVYQEQCTNCGSGSQKLTHVILRANETQKETPAMLCEACLAKLMREGGSYGGIR